MALTRRNGKLVLTNGRLRWRGTISTANPPPTDISLSTTQVDELAPAGTTVGRIDVADPGDTQWNFAITSQSNAGLFIFAGGTTTTSGAFATLITAKQVPGYDVAQSHTVTISATDPSGGAVTKTFTVSVRDTLGDTMQADFHYWPAASRFNAVAEGTAANLTNSLGDVQIFNPSTGQRTGYTWSIISQSTSNLFKLGVVWHDSSGNEWVQVLLSGQMPAWSASVPAHTFTLKAQDSQGRYATATIPVLCLRDGPPTTLYPLDGFTIWDTLKGPVDLIHAAGCVDRAITYSIVNDTRFGIYTYTDDGGVALTVTNPLAPGDYSVTIQAANARGSTDFTRTIKVRAKAALDQTYPWYQHVQAGLSIPAPTTALPQTLRIRNESATASATNEYVWFSLSFPPGLIGNSERPTFTVGGQTLTAQIDGARYWRDDAGNATSFQGGRFCLKLPVSVPGSGSVDVTVNKQAGSLATTEFQTQAASKTALTNAAWGFFANIWGVGYGSDPRAAELNDTRCRAFAAGKHAHTFRVAAPMISKTDGSTHADIFVMWYMTVYDNGATEVMPVVSNSWFWDRGYHDLSGMGLYLNGVLVQNWYPSVRQYGHCVWYAGDPKARPIRSGGTVNQLHADYSLMLPMLWEAGVCPPHKNDLNPVTPNPANPSHTPVGRPFFVNDPNQADGPTTNCNYGNAFGQNPDWATRYLCTGRSDWLNVTRVIAADWGVYGEHCTDTSSWDIVDASEGWSLGVQDRNRYPPIYSLGWTARWSNAQTGGGHPDLARWDEQHRPDPFFLLAYATARPWWLDALCQTAMYSVAWEPFFDPNLNHESATDHGGYRMWNIGGKWYYTGPLRAAERHAAWTMRQCSNAEFLHGDGELRQRLFEDIVIDPYAALKAMCIDAQPWLWQMGPNKGKESENLVAHRPHGWWFARPYTLQPWEGNYLSSTIIMDVMRRRARARPYLTPFALYYLPSVTFGIGGSPTTKGGSGSWYYAWVNDFNFSATNENIQGVARYLRGRGWSEVAVSWKDVPYKVRPMAPGPVPIVNGQPAWYTSSASYSRSGSFLDATGGFKDGTRPIYSRAVAIMGARAGIPNAAECLANYKTAVNYTNDSAYYAQTNYQDRWYIVE